MSRLRLYVLIAVSMFPALVGGNIPGQEKLQSLISDLKRVRLLHPTDLESDLSGAKCGIRYSLAVMEHWEEFTPGQRQEILSLLDAPTSETNRVIGRFRIFYDTSSSSSDTPALLDDNLRPIPGTAEPFVDSVGKFFNEAWDIQVANMGYLPPPVETDLTYHIVVRDFGLRLYGQTVLRPQPIDPGPPRRFATFIEIDNDFRNVFLPSRGIPGLKVTAAHEFHHAIQIGSYGFWGESDLYFYEITSTWMEDALYDQVNDYYQYLFSSSSHFTKPDLRFTRSDGSIEYSRAIWGKFVQKKFGGEIMRRTWESMRQMPSIPALDQAFGQIGTTFREAFLEFAYWNLTTGSTADTIRFYDEGRRYPRIRFRPRVDYISPVTSIADSVQAIASTYARICVLPSLSDTCNPANEMTVIVSNIDASIAYSENRFQYTYTLSGSESPGSKQLANGLYARLEVSDPGLWNTRESIPTVIPDILVFPNPYTIRNGTPIWFRLPSAPRATTASLQVFSSSLDQVFSGDLPILSFRPLEPGVQWEGRDGNRELLRSGIYFYIIRVDGEEFKGKFAVLRE